MKMFRTWYLLLKVSWTQTVATLLFFLLVFVFFPAGWTDAERLGTRRGYWGGFAARMGDPVFWEKALICLAAFAVLQAVFRLLVYYFSLWAGSLGQKR